jgi:stage IV sporulation protein B
LARHIKNAGNKEGFIMKKLAIKITAFVFIMVLALPQSALAARLLIPGGQVIGMALEDDSLRVAGFDEKLGAAAKSAGLRVGDQILKIDGNPIGKPEDIGTALQKSGGTVTLTVRRGQKDWKLQCCPAATEQGPKLGIYLKKGVTGIGTVTWYDPDSRLFGTLGHGVSGPDGKLVQMTGGNAYCANVVSVTRGKAGKPGQLRGSLSSKEPVGQLTANTDQGLFGTCREGFSGTPLPVAQPADVRIGPATIYSTIAYLCLCL